MKYFLQKIFIYLTLFLLFQHAYAQRKMEKLGRGVVVTRTATAKALVSWRLLGTEPDNIGFNVYRSAAGGAAVKLNTDVLLAGTNFEDVSMNFSVANTYFVRTVVNGVEKDQSDNYILPANTATQPFYRVPIKNTAGYYVRYVFSGDLDGDGEFDFVINKQPISDGTKPDLVEGTKRDGTLLWTVDCGVNSTNRDNISPGASALNCGHGDNMTVYDIDCDGKAELIIRTANGVKFADGSTISDSNNSRQYISVVNGLTGAEMSRTVVNNAYLSVGPMNGHMGIAYLDGIHPSVAWESANRNANGAFNEIVSTWDWNGSTLINKWQYDITNKGLASGHQFKIFDIDNDGKDEIVPQAYALNEDGTLLYNLLDQAIDHGDRFFISDMDPARPGLEMYGIQQGYSKTGIQWYYCDAKTGKILESQSSPYNPDMARGFAGDLDPRYPGHEFHTFVDGLYNVSGERTSNAIPSSYPNLRFFWDGDLGSENLDNLKFTKWNYLASNETRLYTASGVSQVARNVPVFYGDIIGDWREEVIYESTDHNYLVVYTSPSFTASRIYTLPHNPGYRSDMAVRGYYQSHMTDFYIGYNMQNPPMPPIQTADKYWIGGNQAWNKSQSNWSDGNASAAFNDADIVMFDVRGANADTVKLSENVAPGKIWVMNPENKNYTIAGNGKITGDGELFKGRAGSVTLVGSHEYTGATTISEGLLNIDGSLQSKVIVKPMGALGGRGTLHAGLELEKGANVMGGRLSPGLGATASLLGTLTIQGNLSVSGNNNLQFDVIPGSTSLNDSLVINGNASFAGISKLIVNFLSNNYQPGTYTLVRVNGTLTATNANFVLEGIDGVSKELLIENNEIKVKINAQRSPASVVWQGATDSFWNFEKANFTLSGTATPFVSQDDVLFDATSGQKNVMLSETIFPASVTFDSSADYLIQGTGNIGGTTGITKNNTGSVSLQSTNNSYTGKTIVNGGKLIINSIGLANQASSIGAAAAVASNIQLNDGTLEIVNTSTSDRGITISGNSVLNIPAASTNAILLGDITGTGSLTKEGDGALFMVGAKTFSGPVVIKSGSVNLRTLEGNVGGLGTSKDITIENATLSMEDVRNYAQAAWNLTVPDGKTATFNTDGRSTLLGSLKGAGTLNINIPYVRTDFKGDWSKFTGKITIASGDFRIANAFGYANAAVNLQDGTIYPITGSGSSIAIGELSGAVNKGISGSVWVVGAKNTNSVFAGNIVSSSLTKVGTGTLTLNGNNTYTGLTTVSAGRLLVNNTAGKRGVGAAAVTVANGAVLGGTGGIKGTVTINPGGKIQPGVDGIGILTDSTGVTLLSGAIAEMDINPSAKTNDLLKVTGGNITLNGTLSINTLGSGIFKIGDSFKLFEANTYSGNFSSIQPATPGTGMEWNFTVSTGTLSVIASSVTPVSLIDFNATLQSNSVKVEWKTASELNNDYFEVERSADGQTFTSLSKIKGQGNSSTLRSYFYDDNAPLNGQNYYRLKQVDKDGKVTLYDVKRVFVGVQVEGISVYPNPFSNSFNIKLADLKVTKIKVRLGAMDGKHLEEIIALSNGAGVFEIKSSVTLASGQYLLRIQAGSITHVQKILVK